MKRHSIIVGNAGCGKSTLIKTLIAEDAEEGLKVLIIDNLKEYDHYFNDENTASHKYVKNKPFIFYKSVNIMNLDIDKFGAKLSSPELVQALQDIFTYAKTSGIDTVYIEDIASQVLLSNIEEFEAYKDSFDIVAVTQTMYQFEPFLIKKIFNEVIVMRILPMEANNLKQNYNIVKYSLNDCLLSDFRSFKIYKI